MKYSLALILLFATFAVAGQTDPIPNLQQPRYNVFTSGQPTAAGFRLIADTGVKTVINVLPTRQCITDEAGMVKINKMAYLHFPFETTTFNKATFIEFGKLLANAEKPVLIHCSTGNHVGGLWFGYRVFVHKVSLAVALREARMIGIKPDLEDAIFNWLANQPQQAGM